MRTTLILAKIQTQTIQSKSDEMFFSKTDYLCKLCFKQEREIQENARTRTLERERGRQTDRQRDRDRDRQRQTECVCGVCAGLCVYVCVGYVCVCVCVCGGGGGTNQKKDGEKTADWQQNNKRRTLVQSKHARVLTQRYVYFQDEILFSRRDFIFKMRLMEPNLYRDL